MELKQIEAIKKAIKTKIEIGDFITLAKIMNLPKGTVRQRYRRNSLNEVLLMQKVVVSREKLIIKLKSILNEKAPCKKKQ